MFEESLDSFDVNFVMKTTWFFSSHCVRTVKYLIIVRGAAGDENSPSFIVIARRRKPTWQSLIYNDRLLRFARNDETGEKKQFSLRSNGNIKMIAFLVKTEIKRETSPFWKTKNHFEVF